MRGEFERAERMLQRAKAAEDKVAQVEALAEAALVKAEALTQDVMGHRSQHWRGQDYADGLDAGIELTAALVREAMHKAGDR